MRPLIVKLTTLNAGQPEAVWVNLGQATEFYIGAMAGQPGTVIIFPQRTRFVLEKPEEILELAGLAVWVEMDPAPRFFD